MLLAGGVITRAAVLRLLGERRVGLRQPRLLDRSLVVGGVERSDKHIRVLLVGFRGCGRLLAPVGATTAPE